jgi:hypothetical protein
MSADPAWFSPRFPPPMILSGILLPTGATLGGPVGQ